MNNQFLSKKTYRSFTQLSRLINQLMRAQCFGETITVQQCYTLEALVEGDKTMNQLASQVGLHQSTLTRVVEKLEKQNLVKRVRKDTDQRTVVVEITDSGRQAHSRLEAQTLDMIAVLMGLMPENRQKEVVRALDTLSDILNPENESFQKLLKGKKNQIKKGEK